MAFCKFCNADLDGGVFCPQCGGDNREAAQTPTAPGEPVQSVQENPAASGFFSVHQTVNREVPVRNQGEFSGISDTLLSQGGAKKSMLWLWITLAAVGVALTVVVILLFVFKPWESAVDSAKNAAVSVGHNLVSSAGHSIPTGQEKTTICYACHKQKSCTSLHANNVTGWYCEVCYPWKSATVEGATEFATVTIGKEINERVTCGGCYQYAMHLTPITVNGHVYKYCDNCFEYGYVNAHLTEAQ